MAVSEVLSPGALAAAVAAHALTHVRVHNLSEVFSGANPVPPDGEPLIPQDGGLRWNDQYSGTSVFVSNGPLIDTWSTPVNLQPLRHKNSPNHLNSNEKRVLTLGAERFVTGLALQVASYPEQRRP